MADYLLRDVPDDLWKRVKVQAAEDGKPIRTIVLDLLADYSGHKAKARTIVPKSRRP